MLAPTLGPLLTAGAAARDLFARLSGMRFRFVQLSATHPGLRPRDLDQSARRDLLATLRRNELAAAGLDAWIPQSHFDESTKVDRAVSALIETIDLAADLGRVPVSVMMPNEPSGIEMIINRAAHRGVELADHRIPVAAAPQEVGVGIDPAAWLSQGHDPAAAVTANATRLVAARLSDLLSSGMRGPIGDRREGRLNILAYQVALSVSGYRRPVVVDARQWIDPWGGLAQSAQAWGAVAGT